MIQNLKDIWRYLNKNILPEYLTGKSNSLFPEEESKRRDKTIKKRKKGRAKDQHILTSYLDTEDDLFN